MEDGEKHSRPLRLNMPSALLKVRSGFDKVVRPS